MEIIDVESNSSSNVYRNNDTPRNSFLSARKRPMSERIAHALKKLTQNSNMKFMENFDPERSNREKRKLSRKVNSGGKKNIVVYDEKGILVSCGKDLCDCMNSHCPGCHFPCTRCHSSKCGHECRVNRKWTYEDIEVDGTNLVIRLDDQQRNFFLEFLMRFLLKTMASKSETLFDLEVLSIAEKRGNAGESIFYLLSETPEEYSLSSESELED